jgi:hypothetical protein
MSFPQVGDTGIQGAAGNVTFISELGIYVGDVWAFASIYGTPDDNIVSMCGFNPLRFQFQSATEISSGQQVTFDITQGDNVPQAVNVHPA